jgi:hypothetical protein
MLRGSTKQTKNPWPPAVRSPGQHGFGLQFGVVQISPGVMHMQAFSMPALAIRARRHVIWAKDKSYLPFTNGT